MERGAFQTRPRKQGRPAGGIEKYKSDLKFCNVVYCPIVVCCAAEIRDRETWMFIHGPSVLYFFFRRIY